MCVGGLFAFDYLMTCARASARLLSIEKWDSFAINAVCALVWENGRMLSHAVFEVVGRGS